jgi:hypothetical protein
MKSALAVLAVTVAAGVANAAPDQPMPYATLELRYVPDTPRVAPGFDKSYGTYLGSGTGKAMGKLNGTVAWDLYEEQSAPELHRTQFVGRITAADGSTVAFETTGYFVPRPGDPQFWDLTSAVFFSHATGSAPKTLAGSIGLWQGYVHIPDPNTFEHRYTIYLQVQ